MRSSNLVLLHADCAACQVLPVPSSQNAVPQAGWCCGALKSRRASEGSAEQVKHRRRQRLRFPKDGLWGLDQEQALGIVGNDAVIHKRQRLASCYYMRRLCMQRSSWGWSDRMVMHCWVGVGRMPHGGPAVSLPRRAALGGYL